MSTRSRLQSLSPSFFQVEEDNQHPRESLSSFDDRLPLLANMQERQQRFQHRFSVALFLRFLQVNSDSIFLIISILAGLIIFLLPPPSGLSESAMDSLGIFISVMICIMTTNFSMSVITSLALSVLVLAKTLECELPNGRWIECSACHQFSCNPYELGFKSALAGFSNPMSWMILSAFHLGFAVQKTNLGKRISLLLMRYLGKNMLTLGYSIFLSELLLAPFIPSNTARGGGIVLPIVMSLVNTLHSTPSENQKVGQFLILCGSHANLLISSLFITGAAPNPIVVGTALKILNIQITFSSWTLGAIVPVVTCLILLPLFFHSIYKPEYDGRVVCEEAEKQLLVLGPMSSNEIKLCIVLGISLILWITGDYTEIPETFVAFLAMVALLILNVLSWTEISSNAIAWDTFYWLSGMLVLAEQLSKLGVSAYIGSHVALLITNITLDTLFATILLSFFYFISMILFSSITGHAIALVGPFLSAGKHLGLAPWLSAILIGFFSSLSACFTHFSTGTVVLYYSQGYFTQQRWWMIGGAVAALYLTIYFTVGLLWLKSLGYY